VGKVRYGRVAGAEARVDFASVFGTTKVVPRLKRWVGSASDSCASRSAPGICAGFVLWAMGNNSAELRPVTSGLAVIQAHQDEVNHEPGGSDPSDDFRPVISADLRIRKATPR
jgi:hypothetical protein